METKSRIIFSLVSLILVIGILEVVSAENSFKINYGNKDYEIKLVFADSDTAVIDINGETLKLENEQKVAPYSAISYDGLEIIFKDLFYSSSESVSSYVVLWVGKDINISEFAGELLKINNALYNINLSFIDSSSVKLNVNGENSKSILSSAKQESSPYYLPNYAGTTSVSGLDLLLKRSYYSQKDDWINYASFLIGKEITLTEEVSNEPTSECGAIICTLYENQNVLKIINGTDYSLSLFYIDSQNVKLKVNGVTSNTLSEGQSQIINNLLLKVNDINYNSLDNKISFVNFSLESYIPKEGSYCSRNSCKLYEGDNVTWKNNLIQISYIDSQNVKLNLNGKILNSLSEGKVFSDQDYNLYIDDIFYLNKENSSNYVLISFSEKILTSSCLNNLCNLYENQKISPFGQEISLLFISSTQINLNIEDKPLTLSEGQSFISEDIKISVQKINYSNLDNKINSVSLEITPYSSCNNNGNCVLWEGQEISFNENKISISYLGIKESGLPEVVVLSVNGNILKSLREGDSTINNHLIISMENILYDSTDNGASKIQFTIKKKSEFFSDIGSFFKKLFGGN